MGEPLPEQALDTAVDPVEIVQQSFDTERRGFDQRQVQQYLRAVADSLQDAQQREADMRTRLGRAVRRAEAAEQALRDAPSHDAAELNRAFGEQVASVLEAARATGEQRVTAAEKSAEQLMANAKAKATAMRAEADAILSERRDEAELAATELVAEGQAEAQELRNQAKAEAEAILAAAADRVERTRDECDGLILEAEEARAQILEDMERRRRQARAQVERLRVGRDRLLRSYDVVRRTLEETTVELKSSLNEAKVRGDGAARAIAAEPAASRDQLEAELRDAKMIGRITISDPVPAASERLAVTGSVRSTALPRPSESTQEPAADDGAAPAKPRRPRVSEAMNNGAPAKPLNNPKAPAVAPALTASTTTEAPQDPIAAMMAAAEAKQAGTAAPVSADLATEPADAIADVDADSIDAELAGLEDDNLNVVEPCDEIEEVVAVPVSSDVEQDPAAPGLFASLRAQRPAKKKAAATKVAAPTLTPAKHAALEEETAPEERVMAATGKIAAPTPSAAAPQEATVVDAESDPAASDDGQDNAEATSGHLIPGIEAQRDAVIADAAKQLEKRLKRALADEQNDLLAGIRAAKKNLALTAIVGDIDTHLNRYVVAIHEVAALTYGAGAALIDAEAAQGNLPAGAVEELLEFAVVSPIRQRLESLDDLKVDAADLHIDPVRAFYRQRKTDHLGDAATRLANLLCVAGVCDALPREAALPWAIPTK